MVRQRLRRSPGSGRGTRRQVGRRVGRLWVAGLLAVGLGGLVAPSAPAGAAASAPIPLLPRGLPGGFARVLAAVPVGPAGRSITGTSSGVRGDLVVPKGAVTAPSEVLVTGATLQTIPKGRLEVPTKQKGLHPIYGVGFLFQRGKSEVHLGRLATVTLSSPRFSRADYVTVYYAAQHAFVPAHRHWARCGSKACVVRLPAGTEIVILGP